MSLRKSHKICDKKSSEQEPSDLTLVDTKPQQRAKGYNKLSRREKELKVIGSVSNNLSGKAFTNNLQTFKAPGGLVQKDVRISSDLISIKFSSPLAGICSSYYIKRWACEDLIADQTDHESKNAPTVKAVKLNWKRGIKFENVSRYSRQNKVVEPEMTTIDFDFESKLKFQKELQSTCLELFPENNITVLDGNDCHGLMVLKSKGINQEEEGDVDTLKADQDTSTVIYVDQDEHEVLLVPFHSKSGFDNDVSKRYKFPYNAKFVVNKKHYEHKFELRLVMDKAPQHFGLIFSFPDTSNPLKSVIVKSLLTVLSVFPTSQRHANLITYAKSFDTNNSQSGGRKQNKSFTKNLNNTISNKLTEENLNNRLVGIGGSINMQGGNHLPTIGCEISYPNQKLPSFYRRKLDTTEKQKDKQSLIKSLKTEARSMDHSNISIY